MEPRIEVLPEKKLVGKSLKMTLANNRTFELWQSFMHSRKEIQNSVSADLYSLQLYEEGYDFSSFNPHGEFEKWAAVEVPDFSGVPDAMAPLTLPGGLYAVFLHKGAAATAPATFQYIFGTWLPASGYLPDNRPHFELLGDKYKNNDPDSEEEIWIPIRKV